jgi:serine/threonine-protein phosphatase 6 regulatory ankyrin repeat subunit A
MIQCCIAGDIALLRRWARQGVRCVSVEPLLRAAVRGKLEVVRILVNELHADVNQVDELGCTAVFVAAYGGHEAMVRFLVKELGADVNKASPHGGTPLLAAAHEGHEAVVRCLVKELGADVNRTSNEGSTPLMAAAETKKEKIVLFLLKYVANPQTSHQGYGIDFTAADISKLNDAPVEQTAYLEARTHCANPGCSGAGLKKPGVL